MAFYRFSISCVCVLLTFVLTAAASGAERPKYVTGGDRDFPPYEFIENGKPTGFNIDLIRAIAEVMDLDMDVRLGPWSEARRNLEQGRIDVLTGMYYTQERARLVDFSVPHSMMSPGLFVRKDSDIHAFSEIRDREIVVQEADSMNDFLKKEGVTSRIITVTDTPEAFRLVAAGKYDGALPPSEIHGRYIANKFGLTNLRVVKTDIAPQHYCFAVSKGNAELLYKLNEGMNILKSTGKYREIFEKWFGVYEKRNRWETLRYYAWTLAVVLLLFCASLIWTWTLRRQVKIRTNDLLESEQKLQAVVNGSPIPQFVINRDHVVIFWNNSLEIMSGIRADEVIGTKQHWKAFYDEERPCMADLLVDGTIESRAERFCGEYSRSRHVTDAYEFTGLFNTRDGGESWFYITTVAIRDSKGSVIGAIESVQDITERKRAEEELREANNRFSSVLRAATAYSIVGSDPQGIITVFNVGAELMLGYDAEEVVGKVTPELFHDPDELAVRASELGIGVGFDVLVSSARLGRTETRDWTYIRKDGSRLTVSLTVTAMKSEQGVLSGFIGISRDITPERKMEQQFLQSQKMETVGLLAGGVSHDFNNLLTPILGYTDLLMLGLSKDDPRFQRLELIRQAASRARELTQRLLVFSRKQLIELKTVDLGNIIRQFEKMLHRMIRENIRIEINISPTLSLVSADAGQIEQVLLNLSVNAQDAMPEGGILLIEAKDVELDDSYAACHADVKPGHYVMLAVGDTGMGMDNKILEHIFEPFYTTKELGKGTGLGLSTVYGIVKQHGGSIDVYSEKGCGSTFKIFLPRAVEGLDCLEEQLPVPGDAVRGVETVLVAEDNQTVRMLACEMLEGLGYHVLSAGDVEKCIALAKEYQEPIDLLLTDVIMPGMNGKELYALLSQVRPGLKVLFMSGYSSDVIGHHGILDESVNYMQKPFSRRLLSEKVRYVLDS